MTHTTRPPARTARHPSFVQINVAKTTTKWMINGELGTMSACVIARQFVIASALFLCASCAKTQQEMEPAYLKGDTQSDRSGVTLLVIQDEDAFLELVAFCQDMNRGGLTRHERNLTISLLIKAARSENAIIDNSESRLREQLLARNLDLAVLDRKLIIVDWIKVIRSNVPAPEAERLCADLNRSSGQPLCRLSFGLSGIELVENIGTNYERRTGDLPIPTIGKSIQALINEFGYRDLTTYDRFLLGDTEDNYDRFTVNDAAGGGGV